VLPAVEHSGLLVTDIEILRLHYAETLKKKALARTFLAHREQVERLYDARFVRMWEFYLAAAEMAFPRAGHDGAPAATRQAPRRGGDDA